MAAHGLSKDSYSLRSENARNAAEPTPLALYQRVFGEDLPESVASRA